MIGIHHAHTLLTLANAHTDKHLKLLGVIFESKNLHKTGNAPKSYIYTFIIYASVYMFTGQLHTCVCM